MLNLKHITFIEGERITLAVPGHLDYPDEILEARLESHNELSKWMGWAKTIPTLEQVKNDIDDAGVKRSNGQAYRFHIYMNTLGLEDDNLFLGSIGVNRIWNNDKAAEIGYWIRTTRHRRGYAREALALLTQYLINKNGIRRVEVRCDVDNTASIGVALSIGMQVEGRSRMDRTKNNGDVGHTLVLSIIESDPIRFRFEGTHYHYH